MKVLTKHLLDWYGKNRVLYPWRKTNQPYKIWLSEILLQQTRIPVAINFYQRILHQYPNLKSLAAAKDSEFIALWSGIGYYRRAHNMLACAREIETNQRGIFPSDLHALLRLPGIGKYTAGAIRNICFGILTPALDGNIRRVLSRLLMKHDDLDEGFVELGKGSPAGEFFQSLMELGERICLPKPQCPQCPVRHGCKAFKADKQHLFPSKKTRKKTEVFHWYFLILNSKESIFYLQNSSRSFLKGAWLFPDLLVKKKIGNPELIDQFDKCWGIRIESLKDLHVIEHNVTFRKILAHVLVPSQFQLNGLKGKWMTAQQLKRHPTSSIAIKILHSL